jgi:pimeloyl-ACP methyl ester carboxylesterase
MSRRQSLAFAALVITTACVAQTESSQRRVEEAGFVPIGGIDQFVTIRGDDASNPVLLLVHGGPGDVQSPFVSEYAPYERAFTLVQWDQRGAGRTYGRYGEATPDLTLDTVVRDGLELAEYLTRHLHKSKIILWGHSWGTVIGADMARRRPALFAVLVGTGQVGSWDRGIGYQHELVLAKARDSGDRALLETLDSLEPFDPRDLQDFLAVNRPMRTHLGTADSVWLAGIRQRITDVTTPEEPAAIGSGMNFSGATLFPTQVQEDLFSTAPNFEIPFVVIQGQHDLFTPTPVAIDYFEHVQAPRKELRVIEGAGHFVLVTHQDEVLAALLETTGQ